MQQMSNPTVTTAEHLLILREPGCRHELVDGELRRMSPAGFWHGIVVAAITRRLGDHVAAGRLGAVFGAETGFLIDRSPDTVRAPDVAFVRAERVPEPGPGFFPGPPDLAVEVRSPSDTAAAVQEKVVCWLRHGTRLVWVVDPVAGTVTAHDPDGETRLAGDAELSGGDVLPGFRVSVHDFVPRAVRGFRDP